MVSVEGEIRARLAAGELVESVIGYIRGELTVQEWTDYELYLVGVGPLAEVEVEAGGVADLEQSGLLWAATADVEDVLIDGLPARLRDTKGGDSGG